MCFTVLCVYNQSSFFSIKSCLLFSWYVLQYLSNDPKSRCAMSQYIVLSLDLLVAESIYVSILSYQDCFNINIFKISSFTNFSVNISNINPHIYHYIPRNTFMTTVSILQSMCMKKQTSTINLRICRVFCCLISRCSEVLKKFLTHFVDRYIFCTNTFSLDLRTRCCACFRLGDLVVCGQQEHNIHTICHIFGTV